MVPLSVFPRPLPQNQPPDDYAWSDRPLASLKTRVAFGTGIDSRDRFRGTHRSIVCGLDSASALQRCHIVGQAEDIIWDDLKRRHWVPSQVKTQKLEPRNGVLMCSTHHIMFDAHQFFIRYMPPTQRFVLINFSDNTLLQQFYGKAVALDIHDALSPFPSLFIFHEMRTLGYHPFKPISPDISPQTPWQD